jgi:hypothetical protein
MGIPQSSFAPWIRKHDKPGTPLIPEAPLILFPRSLEDLIDICKNRPAAQHLHAAGSHWALSTAAVSDHTFIETHDFNEQFAAMGRTLFDVVPGCLAEEFLESLNAAKATPDGAAPRYFYHFESGKRIYQLYAEMDVGDSKQERSLAALMMQKFGNASFQGSWAFHTLGGAGGQTVVGALSTGTHGGDFDRPPIADCVVALHVVTDGGKHFWIEQSRRDELPFTDRDKLQALFGVAKFGGPDNFEVIYDTNVWRAARLQVGRFGIVYSAVIHVEPQYGLQQEVALDTWENVRDKIADPGSELFIQSFTPASGGEITQRFLQIAINPIPSANGASHVCTVTRHWTLKLSDVIPAQLPAVNWGGAGNPAGRPERVGNLVQAFDPILRAPRFANAGTSIAFSPGDSGVISFNMFDAACADANFMDGIVSGIYTEIENFLSNNAVPIGGGLATALALGAGPGILALAPWLLALLALLAIFLNSLRHDGSTVGQAFNNLRSALLGSSNPAQRAAGILVWRAIAGEIFTSQQSTTPFSAISYAVMDGHNYQDISCAVNVRSVEVFFAATDPNLLTFVDRLLQFEIDQEFQSGFSVAGYISLRFCQSSNASIAPEAFARTVAIECSGLADELGSIQFVDFAVALALDPNINGILHWGQQNSSTQAEIEFRFGDSPDSPTGALHDWRAVLAQLTNNGRLDGFCSEFTRQTGLEVVQPAISAFAVSTIPTAANPNCTVAWDCSANPPGTTVTLNIVSPSAVVSTVAGLPLAGSHTFATAEAGDFKVTLQASLTRSGTRTASQTLIVQAP